MSSSPNCTVRKKNLLETTEYSPPSDIALLYSLSIRFKEILHEPFKKGEGWSHFFVAFFVMHLDRSKWFEGSCVISLVQLKKREKTVHVFGSVHCELGRSSLATKEQRYHIYEKACWSMESPRRELPSARNLSELELCSNPQTPG